MSRVAIACPACGELMNLHAEKLVAPRNAAESAAAAADPALDGVLVEEQQCPACGFEVERPAARP